MSAPRIVDIDRLECQLKPFSWKFDESRADEIDRHFEERRREKPALYDGRVLLASRVDLVTIDGARVLEVDAFETRFSRFLAWRDFGFPDRSVTNFFSMPAVRSSDGAYLVGEMGRAHSSAGALYFPAGTPDLSDVVGDARVDLFGSLARELAEETGLAASDGAGAPDWQVVFDRQYVACLKHIDWPAPASALRERVRAFIFAEANPEISDVHMIARREQLDDPRLPGFMVAYLARVLGGGGEGAEFRRLTR